MLGAVAALAGCAACLLVEFGAWGAAWCAWGDDGGAPFAGAYASCHVGLLRFGELLGCEAVCVDGFQYPAVVRCSGAGVADGPLGGGP